VKRQVRETLIPCLCLLAILPLGARARAALPPGCGTAGTLPPPLVTIEPRTIGPLSSSEKSALTLYLVQNMRRLAPGVTFQTPEEVQGHLQEVRDRQLEGAEGGTVDKSIASFEFAMFATFTKDFLRYQHSVTLVVYKVSPVSQVAYAKAEAVGAEGADNFSLIVDAADRAAERLASGDLLQQLRAAQERPIEPRLCTQLTPLGTPPPAGSAPNDVRVGGVIRATVTLLDADGSAFADKVIAVKRISQGAVSSMILPTDANGQVRADFPVGDTAGGGGIIEASYTRGSVTWPAQDQSYHVIGPTALEILVRQAVVTTGTTLPLTAHLVLDDAPAATQAIAFAAEGGTVSSASAATDADGRATVNMVMGNEAGIATGRATWHCSGVACGSPPRHRTPAAAQEATAERDFAVEARARLTLFAADTDLAGGDLTLVQLMVDASGERLTAVPVSFSVDVGAITVRDTETDAFGQAQTYYAAPDSSDGTATLTARVVVQGEVFTKSVSIDYHGAEGGPMSGRLLPELSGGGCPVAPVFFVTAAIAHNGTGLTFATLGGTYDYPPADEQHPNNCRAVDFGEAKALPVTLSASGTRVGIPVHSEWTMSQPSASTIAWDVSTAHTAFAAFVLELKFDRPGTLNLHLDISSFPFGFVRVDGPNPVSSPSLSAPIAVIARTGVPGYGPADRSIAISGPQTMVFNGYFLQPPSDASGRVLTFTFTPAQ